MFLKILLIAQTMLPSTMLPYFLLFFIFTVYVLNDKWIRIFLGECSFNKPKLSGYAIANPTY